MGTICRRITFWVLKEKLKKLRSILSTWSRNTFGDFFKKLATQEDIVR